MQKSVSLVRHVLMGATLSMAATMAVAVEEEARRVEPDGTVHVRAFDLPETAYLSEDSRAAMKHFREVYGPEFGTFSEGCANLVDVRDDPEAIRAARQCVAEGYYRTAIYKDTVAKHPVEITHEDIAGIYTEVFVPKAGIADANKSRLLISIHGGGFVVGARYFSHTEAMQVADVGGYRVISPDYRMAPEFTHPAGVEDVVAVYRAVLEDYDAASVGIYGCSAGAMLTAQTIAYILDTRCRCRPRRPLLRRHPHAGPRHARDLQDEPGEALSSYPPSWFSRPSRWRSLRQPNGYFRGVARTARSCPGDHDEFPARFPRSAHTAERATSRWCGVLAATQAHSLGVEAACTSWEGLGMRRSRSITALPEAERCTSHRTLSSTSTSPVKPADGVAQRAYGSRNAVRRPGSSPAPVAMTTNCRPPAR